MQLLERPQDFVHQPTPSRVPVHPAVVVVGPPLAGKTSLAKQLAERTGAVYLSVPEVIRHLCGPDSLPCELSREILENLQVGKKIPEAAIIKALRHRMAAPDVLNRGWIMDDFPLTKGLAEQLTAAGVVPHRLLVVDLPESYVFSRVANLAKAGATPGADLVQQEAALQRKRIEAYKERAPMLRAYYALNYDNVVDIDGTKSFWAIFDRALKETSAAISQRLRYYRLTSEGKAAPIFGMCFTSQRITASDSAWRGYCPVLLSLNNELVATKDPRYMVEYNSKIYGISSAENMALFLDDPESFLQVPLPSNTPQQLAICERRNVVCQLEDYCAVALVDKKELVKACGQHIVTYQGKFWSLEGKEACEKFMRRPMRYVQRAKLPAKRPPLKGAQSVALLRSLSTGVEKGLEPAEMLTYMQASVAEVICQALVESGERRPLCPGKTPHESALLFLARFLRARNPLNTELSAEKVREQFDEFLNTCALPQNIKEFTERKQKQDSADWTGHDSRQYAELCRDFDKILGSAPK